jgi:hypothetical protein
MDIRTRLSINADGYVATQDGWPPLVRDPQFVSGQSHGFPAFQERCEAVLMGRTTFEPALGHDRWPGRPSTSSSSAAMCPPKARPCRS